MKTRTNIGPPGVAHPGGWLSRKDWRRALHLYLDGRITRSEFEKMKERLTRVRVGAAGRVRPFQVRPPQAPRLQLVPGGLAGRAAPEPGEPTPPPARLPREAA
jgi:hypothetical protein